jgi:hypothetical protein
MPATLNPDLNHARRGKWAVTEYVVRDEEVVGDRIIAIFRDLEDAKDFALYLRDRYGDLGLDQDYQYEIETAKNAGMKAFD